MPLCRLVTLLMDHKETQSPAQQRRQLQIAELIRNTWGFGKDFSVNEVKHVLGILSVNSFVVHDGAEDGLDLIGKLSLVSSEMYNACYYFMTKRGETSGDWRNC